MYKSVACENVMKMFSNAIWSLIFIYTLLCHTNFMIMSIAWNSFQIYSDSQLQNLC